MDSEIPGILSVIHMTTDERETFLDYLGKTKPGLNADFIFSVLGDEQFLKFFDVFADENLKVPSREEVVKLIKYVKIYSYCKKHGFTEDSFEKAAKIFGKRRTAISRIIDKVNKIMAERGSEVDE